VTDTVCVPSGFVVVEVTVFTVPLTAMAVLDASPSLTTHEPVPSTAVFDVTTTDVPLDTHCVVTTDRTTVEFALT
jgi:hypothetical protein